MGTRTSLEPNISWRSGRSGILPAIGLVFLLFLSAAAHSQGKGRGVEVRAASPKLVDTEPGRIISASFLVTNKTDREEEFTESLRLPSDWQAILPQAVFTLRPSEAQARLVAFAIPSGAPAGSYEVAYTARSQRDYDIQDADTVTIVVLPISKLALLVEESPDVVIAGDVYRLKLRLVNQGNAPIPATIRVKTEKSCRVAIDPDQVALPPGGTAVVDVSVQTDPNERQRHRQAVLVTAQSEGEPVARLTVTVDIVPRVTGQPDLYHRLPAALVLRTVSEGGEGGFQGELAGSGTLDEAGTRDLSFLFRGPDIQSVGVYGLRDESWLNYSTPDLDVRLGDQSYGLSRLTGYYRYGLGLGISAHPPNDPFELGAYRVASRWESPETDETAAYVSNRFGRDLTLKMNLLHKERAPAGGLGGLDDDLWSIECRTKMAAAADLWLEYGSSNTDGGGGARDDAYLIECSGTSADRVAYSLSRIRAGPDYAGYYRDCEYAGAALTFPVGGRMQARLSHQRWRQNLSLRPDSITAPQEELLQMGLNYRLPRRWYLSLEHDSFRRRDLFEPTQYDRRERPFMVGVGRASDRYNLRLELRRGTQEDLLSHDSSRKRRYGLYASYRPSPRMSFTLYGEAGDTAERGTRLLGASNNVGGSLTWKPTERLLLSFYYLKYGFDSSVACATDQAELLLGYTQANGSLWTLRARRNSRPLSGRGPDSVALSYSIPFGVPVAKKTSAGVVQGRVYDAGAPNHPGVAKVILTANGATAVTDSSGRFFFPYLAPGTYSLQVDERSIGLNRVTTRKLPILVEVKPGEITTLSVGVVESSRLSGTVTIVPANGTEDVRPGDDGEGPYVVGDPSNAAAPERATGLANVLVELSNGDELLRRVTDNRGRFLFEGLRSGKWLLLVHDHNLPPYHYLKTPEMEIELAPAQSTEITIEVLPRKRRIKLIDDGEADSVIPERYPDADASDPRDNDEHGAGSGR
jgi:hypothetical protein